ncbi:MAG: hypothetical protein AAF541_22875 [Pseudomonadota bacterium]
MANVREYLTKLNLARASLVISIIIGEGSLGSTFDHIGDDKFRLAGFGPDGGFNNTHSWFHFFREGVADVATLILLCLLLFGPQRFRSPETWTIGIILCLGYYAPFWIGAPFNSALIAPNLGATMIHVGMAAFAFLAMLLARKDFYRARSQLT